jgi:hypothetical protein
LTRARSSTSSSVIHLKFVTFKLLYIATPFHIHREVYSWYDDSASLPVAGYTHPTIIASSFSPDCPYWDRCQNSPSSKENLCRHLTGTFTDFVCSASNGFRVTSQAYRHKARKHKLRRYRFRVIISTMFNYRCCLPFEQGRKGLCH